MPAPDAITPDKLAKLIGTPRCPIILDNRRDALRAEDPLVLPGARALPEADLASERLAPLIATLQGPVVVACAEGHGRSQGLAALLRSQGIAAEYLVGGFAAWRDAGLPLIDPGKITVIHRGVDTAQFHPDYKPPEEWRTQLMRGHPQLAHKPLILMPGRLSRWKGQLQFIDLIEDLTREGTLCHGVIVGGPQPGKESYLQELQDAVRARGLNEHITFLGHRSDMANIYPLASVVCNLSQHAEPFGRTVIEALAMGVPVVSYDYGGPAESLRECFPRGLVPLGDREALRETVKPLLSERPQVQLAPAFTLQHQASATLAVYDRALRDNRRYASRK